MIPKPSSPYAVSKYAGELYCNVYRLLYDLPTITLRYFNVFGPRQQLNTEYSAVIPCFLDSALNGNALRIEGYGDQTRDFTYVQNVVDANLLACHSDVDIGDVFNIGCGHTTSINELVGIVEDITGRQLSVERTSPRMGDILHSMADIGKAQDFLGYEPKTGLKEGLELTWKWMQNQSR